MTENELKLLEIAKEAIELNKNIGAKLTGSLMLAVIGLNKRREATDIDIICDILCEDKKSDGFLFAPKGFELNYMDGSRSEVKAIKFVNSEGLKIEFMHSEEISQKINGILCGELKLLIEAKKKYSENDLSDESRQKHADDLDYLFKNNSNII